LSGRASKLRGLLWLLAAAALATGGAIAFPHLVRLVPWSAERALGSLAAMPVSVCREGGAGAADDLSRLVARVFPVLPGDEELPITVEVVHGKEVNAYATLGGHIYVLDGLLRQAQSPEELAGVLAHEIEHVRNRHILQAVAVDVVADEAIRAVLPSDSPIDPRFAHLFLNLQFSRKQEAEADALGLARMRAAGVDAAGLEQFFARVGRLSQVPPILSNHPSPESRSGMVAASRGYPVRPVLAPDAWRRLAAMCGAS